jgi:hypothetical protein
MRGLFPFGAVTDFMVQRPASVRQVFEMKRAKQNALQRMGLV